MREGAQDEQNTFEMRRGGNIVVYGRAHTPRRRGFGSRILVFVLSFRIHFCPSITFRRVHCSPHTCSQSHSQLELTFLSATLFFRLLLILIHTLLVSLLSIMPLCHYMDINELRIYTYISNGNGSCMSRRYVYSVLSQNCGYKRSTFRHSSSCVKLYSRPRFFFLLI